MDFEYAFAPGWRDVLCGGVPGAFLLTSLGGCWGYLGLAAGCCNQNLSITGITILINDVLKQGLSLDKFAFFNL